MKHLLILIAMTLTITSAHGERRAVARAASPAPAPPLADDGHRGGTALSSFGSAGDAPLLKPKRVGFLSMPGFSMQHSEVRRPPLREVGLSDFLKPGSRFGNSSSPAVGIFEASRQTSSFSDGAPHTARQVPGPTRRISGLAP